MTPLPRARPHWRRFNPRLFRHGPRIGLGLALVAAVGTGVWLWKSGAVARSYQATIDGAVNVSADLGLRVNDVVVEGRNETSPAAILDALQARRGMPLLGLDLAAAKARLEALPWVRTASVERRWPGMIFVGIVERTPLALWQRDGAIKLIDLGGKVIEGADIHRFANLPMVVGEGAAAQAPGFLDILSKQPALARRVDAAIWVGNRRWNLHLTDGIDVRLPEDAPEQALARLTRYEADEHLFERDIVMIDMRLPDRLIVRLAPDAVQNDGKAGKAAGRKPGRNT